MRLTLSVALVLAVAFASLAAFPSASAAPPVQLSVKAPPGIAIGKEVNVTVNVTGGPGDDLPAGERNYTVKAWLTGDVLEGAKPLVGTPFTSNQTNGNFTVPVTAPAKKATITLVVEAISRGRNGTQESARKEFVMKSVNPITIKVTLENKGDVTAKDVALNYYLDESYIGNSTAGEVPANNRTNVSFEHAPPDLAPGRHVIKILLDPKGQMVEFEEGNNVLEREFFIHEEPSPLAQPLFVFLVFVFVVGLIGVAWAAPRKKEK